jgi:hypothetical protein
MARKLRRRRSVIFPQVRKGIVDALRNGALRPDAAKCAGINKGLLDQWLYRGRHGMEPYVSFVSEVEAAEAEAAIQMTQAVFSAGSKDWRAAAEWLKKNRPDVWGDKVKVDASEGRRIAQEIAGEFGKPVEEVERDLETARGKLKVVR